MKLILNLGLYCPPDDSGISILSGNLNGPRCLGELTGLSLDKDDHAHELNKYTEVNIIVPKHILIVTASFIQYMLKPIVTSWVDRDDSWKSHITIEFEDHHDPKKSEAIKFVTTRNLQNALEILEVPIIQPEEVLGPSSYPSYMEELGLV